MNIDSFGHLKVKISLLVISRRIHLFANDPFYLQKDIIPSSHIQFYPLTSAAWLGWSTSPSSWSPRRQDLRGNFIATRKRPLNEYNWTDWTADLNFSWATHNKSRELRLVPECQYYKPSSHLRGHWWSPLKEILHQQIYFAPRGSPYNVYYSPSPSSPCQF